VAGNGGALIWPQLVGFVRAKEYLFIGDLMTAAEAERIGLINHVVPADQLDEKVYGLARQLAGGAMRSIRRTKQVIKIPLRQLAHSMMDAVSGEVIGGRSLMIVRSRVSVSGSKLLCPAVVMR
jgi:enoyl-CoA hydratase